METGRESIEFDEAVAAEFAPLRCPDCGFDQAFTLTLAGANHAIVNCVATRLPVALAPVVSGARCGDSGCAHEAPAAEFVAAARLAPYGAYPEPMLKVIALEPALLA